MENKEVFRLHIEGNENTGVWIGFPCNAESFKNSLIQAGFSSEDMANFKITEFVTDISEYSILSDFLLPHEAENTDDYISRNNIDEFNYLAVALSDLNEPDKAVFCAAVKAGEHNENVKELINLAYNTEYYKIITDISDWADYGKYIARRDGFNIDNIGEIVNYFDFEKYGKHHANDLGGYLLDGIFLETGWTEFDNVYDGNKLNIPFEYRIINFGLDKDKKDYIPILGKSPSIYKDTMLLTGLDNKIYVGHKDNIYTTAQGELFYNNADNSYTFVSENERMGILLSNLVWGVSQNDLKSMGVFSDKDYEEFNKIQTEILADYTIVQPVSFLGVPFSCPTTEERKKAFENQALDELQQATELSYDLYAFFQVSNKEYFRKNGSFQEKRDELADCLLAGNTIEIKRLLYDSRSPDTAKNALISKLASFEKEFNKSGRSFIWTCSACNSRYNGMVAFVGADNKVYLGKKENYLFNSSGVPLYDNSDNSLTFISDNEKMYYFLYGNGYTVTQEEMLNTGYHKESDYAEFANLQKGVLSQFEETQEFTFAGKPFNYTKTAKNVAEQNDTRPDIHLRDNNGIISFGTSSTNVIISTNSQHVKINDSNNEKSSIKEQLHQTKKEQGKRTEQKPHRQTPPEL